MDYREGMDDEAIRTLVTRLARAHPSGGTVIERAAIMAEGAGAKDVMTWIEAHGGEPEALVAKVNHSGLHGLPARDSGGAARRSPARFVLPAGALEAPVAP
jgi:hypothetical protein